MSVGSVCSNGRRFQLVPINNHFYSDPSDFNALTPAHFPIGEPLMGLPERDITQIPMNQLNQRELIKQAHQSFWTRWSQEYLHTLQG